MLVILASQKFRHLQDENQRLKEQMSQLQDKRRSIRSKIVPASDAGAQCDLVTSKPSDTVRRLSIQLQTQEETIKRLIQLSHEKDFKVKQSKRGKPSISRNCCQDGLYTISLSKIHDGISSTDIRGFLRHYLRDGHRLASCPIDTWH